MVSNKGREIIHQFYAQNRLNMEKINFIYCQFEKIEWWERLKLIHLPPPLRLTFTPQLLYLLSQEFYKGMRDCSFLPFFTPQTFSFIQCGSLPRAAVLFSSLIKHAAGKYLPCHGVLEEWTAGKSLGDVLPSSDLVLLCSVVSHSFHFLLCSLELCGFFPHS